jgi:GTP-binding protein EngB required for normal cell division
MSGMEEYEHFSDEFMKYWKKPGNTTEIKDIQTEFNKNVHEIILKNLKTLEKCIKKNTENIQSNEKYDIKFECRGLEGLPNYKVIDQGYGDISKPSMPDEYSKLKYLEKPLKTIGLTRSNNVFISPNKNEFIIHPGFEFNEFGNPFGHIDIRISNSKEFSNIDFQNIILMGDANVTKKSNLDFIFNIPK